MAQPKNIAIYLRQSKDSEGNELAISRQLAACTALCNERAATAKSAAEKRMWENPKVFTDNNRSATNGKPRPKYQELLKDIGDDKVARVLAWHQDRLSRDVMETIQFGALALAHDVKLTTVCGGDIDLESDDGEFMAIIGAAVNRKEIRRKSARQREAAKQRAETTGRPWWPSRPFGYDGDPDESGKWWTTKGNPTRYNEIRLHPIEAPLMKQAYTDFLAGTSLREIARKWNEAGVETPKGHTWSGPRVREVLVLARYAGLREYHGQVVGTGTWDKIVTEEVWGMAHARLTSPSRRVRTFSGRKYLLSGLALCGACGKTITSQISSRGQRQYGCYHCRKVSRSGPKLDTVIVETVIRRLSREDAVELLATDEEVDRDALVEQRRALKDRLAQLGKDFANAPPEFTQAALNDVNEKLDAINAVLDDPGKARMFEGLIGAEDVHAAWESLDLGRQRTVVDALMTITINTVGKGSGRVFDPDAIVDGKRAIDVQWK